MTRIHLDPPTVRETDAARLMAHHLSLAAMYFEATPETTAPGLAAIADAFSSNEIGLTSARIWFESMTVAYDDADQLERPAHG